MWNTVSKALAVWALIAAASVAAPAAAAPRADVVLQTRFGAIKIALFTDRAPKTVQNFLAYVRSGFYDGTIFHRVIPGFVIQAGGYTRSYRKKTTHPPVVNESHNGLSNRRGTLAMARTRRPDSATSQFFINLTDNPRLDARPNQLGYAVFGEVVDGMAVVSRIARQPTGAAGPFDRNAPQQPIAIQSARVLGTR